MSDVTENLPAFYPNLSSYEKKLVRERYVIEQKGKCFWCKTHLKDQPPNEILSRKIDWRKFPKGFLNYPVHLQHNHQSGLTEGAVHAYCNAVMWQYYRR